MMRGLLGKLGEPKLKFWLKHLSLPQEPTLIELCHRLLQLRGEASVVLVADQLNERCNLLDTTEERAFFESLLNDFQPDQAKILASAQAYSDNPSPETANAIAVAAEAPREALFRQMGTSSHGIASLIRLRERLKTHLKSAPHLKTLDQNLVRLFRSWFNRGFLQLRRIDWTTPAHILEKLIEYEAVHAINGWQDLRRRLAEDRRCYAFFHPVLQDEPLVFVEVALMQDVPERITDVIDHQADIDLSKPTTAIFYSISNCQQGLTGVSFGNFLIKQVIKDLSKECPSIRESLTLSPIPGFRRWLNSAVQTDGHAVSPELANCLNNVEPDESTLEPHKDELMTLCAQYLSQAKRGMMPLDPVARFHLGNGARIERLNWLADTSQRGFNNSLGMMVNYRYTEEWVEQNHEALVNSGHIAMSGAFKKWLNP